MEMDGGNPVLPLDAIRSILIRLPVKSLIRFQCVCKEWKNLFKTPSFIAEHLRHSSHRSPFHIFEDYVSDPFCVSLLDPEMRVLEVQSHPFIDSIQRVSAIDSCNGLICLEFANVPTSLSLSLWNPATRELRLVPEAVDTFVDGNFHVGFGFSPTIDDYMIVKIRDSEKDYMVDQVEVYSLNKGTWKEVGFEKLEGVTISSNGFTSNEAIFWTGSMLAVNEDEDEDKDDIVIIISFDIATEVFTLIPMPSHISISYRLTVCENKLAVLSHTLSEDLKSSWIHLWVMEEGTCASGERWRWTKKYTSNPYCCMSGYTFVPVTIWRNEIICHVVELPGPVDQVEDEDEDNGERKIVTCNFRTNEFKMFDIRNFFLGYGIFNYTESLVPVGKSTMDGCGFTS